MKLLPIIRSKGIRGLGLALAAGAFAWYLLPFAVPLPKALLEVPGASPFYLDRHGEILARLTLWDSTRASGFDLRAVPADLIACTLAAEDKRYWNHGGVDLLAIARAGWDAVRHKRFTSGASTITQQLIKISSPTKARNWTTKVHEALAARHLEMKWSKTQILTAYLNRLDYGNRSRGSVEAARFYFQKPLQDLSLAECALLAGLPQAPSRLNPLRHPQRALTRRTTVLRRYAQFPQADAERIATAHRENPDFRRLKIEHTAPWLGTPGLAATPIGNGKIPTTLDRHLQNDLEAVVREETEKLKHANLRHAAVVVLHNPTGEILALVSSASWADARGGQINGALTPRSPGSALKPFTYLLAITRNQRLPSSILADVPTSFRTPEGLDLPQNYDRSFRGPVSLRTALACSLNIPALRELNAMGGPAPLEDFLIQLGITTMDRAGSENAPSAYGLGLTLGNAPVRLLELTQAYATLARQGVSVPFTLFPNQRPTPPPTTLFPAAAAYQIADVLSDTQARAPSFPPGGPLDLPFRCAVKTGTSSDFRDNWCIGFTQDFTVGVWAGNFENQPMKNISGLAGAGPIFQRTMLHLHRDQAPTWFTRPADLLATQVDYRNGKSPLQGTLPHYLRSDLAPRTQLPPPATTADYDATGRALLGAQYTEWFHGPHNFRKQELALDDRPILFEPLRIISPARDITLLLDPDIPSPSDRLRPVTNLPGLGIWRSETLQILPGAPEPTIQLRPGTHQLTLTDPRTQTSQTITLHVQSL